MVSSLIRSWSNSFVQSMAQQDTELFLNNQKVILHHDSKFKHLRDLEHLPEACEMLDGIDFSLLFNCNDLAWKKIQKVGLCIQKINQHQHRNILSLIGDGFIEHLLKPSGSLLPKVYLHFTSSCLDHFIIVSAVGSLTRRAHGFDKVVLVEEQDIDNLNTLKLESLHYSMPTHSKQKLKLMVTQDLKWLTARKLFGYTLFIGVVGIDAEHAADTPDSFSFPIASNIKLEIVFDNCFSRYSNRKWPSRIQTTTSSSYAKQLALNFDNILDKIKSDSQPCALSLMLDTWLIGKSLEQLLVEVKRLTDTHLCGDAVAVLIEARKLYCRENGLSYESMATPLSTIDADPRVLSAVRDEALFKHLLEEMVSPIWKLHGKSRGCQVSTDSRPGKQSHFRCETVMDLDLLSCLAVSNEVHDYKLWMPSIDTSEVIHVSSSLKRVGRISGWKPWPLGREEMIIAATGAVIDSEDLLGRDIGYGQGILIHIAPAPQDWKRTEGLREVDLKGGYWFQPISAHQTRVVFVAEVDPHIHIPDVLMNWIIANVAYLVLPMQYKQAKAYAPGGALFSRVNDTSGDYPEIRRNCEILIENLSKKKAYHLQSKYAPFESGVNNEISSGKVVHEAEQTSLGCSIFGGLLLAVVVMGVAVYWNHLAHHEQEFSSRLQ